MSDRSEPLLRAAIVTGAAAGIGNSIALHLAAEGWRVLAFDCDREALARLDGHPHLLPFPGDVTAEEDIERSIQQAEASFGRIDAVVSNAGISGFQPLRQTTLDDWNRVLAVNLTPAFLFARGAEQALRKTRGSIVLIASTRAHMSEPGTLAYSASKGALVALTHSLAISLGPDVRVNCLSPGWIQVSEESLRAEDRQQHPAGRVGQPADIAAAVSFLLAETSGFITGAELIIDGGMTRKMIYR